MTLRSVNDARVSQLFDLVVAGLNRAQILKYVREKTDWGIGARQIDRLTARARDMLSELAETKHDKELGKAIARLDMLFARSLQINDFKACLAIERERIALLKLGDKPRRGPTPQPADALALRGSWRAKQAALREASNN